VQQVKGPPGDRGRLDTVARSAQAVRRRSTGRDRRQRHNAKTAFAPGRGQGGYVVCVGGVTVRVVVPVKERGRGSRRGAPMGEPSVMLVIMQMPRHHAGRQQGQEQERRKRRGDELLSQCSSMLAHRNCPPYQSVSSRRRSRSRRNSSRSSS
jgi:hypothetical protein